MNHVRLYFDSLIIPFLFCFCLSLFVTFMHSFVTSVMQFVRFQQQIQIRLRPYRSK